MRFVTTALMTLGMLSMVMGGASIPMTLSVTTLNPFTTESLWGVGFFLWGIAAIEIGVHIDYRNR